MGQVNDNNIEASVVRQGKDKNAYDAAKRSRLCLHPPSGIPFDRNGCISGVEVGRAAGFPLYRLLQSEVFRQKGLVHELQDDQLSKRYKHACPICRGA